MDQLRCYDTTSSLNADVKYQFLPLRIIHSPSYASWFHPVVFSSLPWGAVVVSLNLPLIPHTHSTFFYFTLNGLDLKPPTLAQCGLRDVNDFFTD
ncbi:hypothetical protein EVAR_25135_1 [Eumeta japonica]|uniref:Uncharacterized protein n=1 Tax=Eumeta variegata TaxID=151549 RepID=A0A4C1XN51_EUMVA|nr:hypothetical protein EVAR_25135_1 [Eumeta japonica]